MTSARSLPPHLSAAVRSAELARVVGQVLGQVPRPVDLPANVELAWPVMVPEPVSLPQVQTIGPWSEPVEVAEPSGASRRVRVAAVKAATVRSIAWEIDRNAAVRFTRELPDDGCVWALYLDATPLPACAVLCLRIAPPSRPSRPRPRTPPPTPPGRPMLAPSAPSSPPTSKRRSVG